MNSDVPQELIDAGHGYESLFVPALFETWTKHLIAGAAIQEGAHVLDVACGTGVLARNALSRVGPSGRVVGIDPAPGMLAAAAEIEPRVDWVLGAAEAVDAADGSFDSVVSQFGMMFFADRQRAADEMFRVLKPGGSLAVAIWNSVDENPAYGDIIQVLQEQVGMAAADALRLPYSLGDAAESTSVLQRSGFADVKVDTTVEAARFPSSRHMVEAELRAGKPGRLNFCCHVDVGEPAMLEH